MSFHKSAAELSISSVGEEDLEIPAPYQGHAWRYKKSNIEYPMHRHRELEMGLTLRGSGWYLVGERRYPMQRHVMVWLFPQHDHILLDETSDYEMWTAVFKPEIIQGVCATPLTQELTLANPPGQFCRKLPSAATEWMTTLIEELNTRRDDPDYYNAGMGFLLMTAWAAFQEAERGPVGAPVHPAVEKAVRLIRNETQPLTLESIADEVGLSPSRLSYLFRKDIGTPLLAFRDQRRIERFLRIYGQGDRVTMLEAALAAGFGSYPQFHRVFKQTMGCSPSRYGAK